MTAKSSKYVVITPVRDEKEHIQSTIESMVRQTVLPGEWIIVDDGSKDGTGEIIDEYARQYPWIKAIHRQDRGFRSSLTAQAVRRPRPGRPAAEVTIRVLMFTVSNRPLRIVAAHSRQ